MSRRHGVDRQEIERLRRHRDVRQDVPTDPAVVRALLSAADRLEQAERDRLSRTRK